jgi:hypothetical protein
MRQVCRTAALTILVFSAAAGLAQAAATPAPTPAPARTVGSIAGRADCPKAKLEDVQSPDAIVAAVYSVISGGKGQSRDWDRMRSLFVPDARLIPAIMGKDGHNDVLMLSVDGYIERSGTRLTNDGFFERSIHNEMEQFGNIVQVWSTYESRHNLEDNKPFARGINSFQLLKDGDRYWVVNIFWDSESPSKPIPAKYLP